MDAKHRPWLAAARFCTLVLLTSGFAKAEPTGAERAAAESLFQSGTSLMAEQKFAPACEKFEGSLELDPALGTMLRLADCYDRVGKTASAWATFQDAASLARTRNEAVREQMAEERGADLEKRLSRLRLRIQPTPGVSDLAVRIGKTRVPQASFDTPLPVDPGSAEVEVTASGHKPWSTHIEVSAGPSVQTLAVPALEALPRTAAPAPAPARPEVPAPAPSPGGTQRTLAYVAGAAGIAALATGGVLAYRANALNQQSYNHCRPDDHSACTAEGVSERNDARSLATATTLAGAAGGVLLAGGLALLLTAPSSESAPAPAPAIRVTGMLAPRGGNLSLSGRW